MILILASASPRRRKLLATLGEPFLVVPSLFDESSLSPDAFDPSGYALALAAAKAEEVAGRRGGVDETVLAADTIVISPDGVVLNKPAGTEDAARMLRLLSGKTHSVVTALCVLDPTGRETRHAETTRVTFRDIPDGEMIAYASSGEPLDKAGAYGIQEGASRFVQSVDGDYYNVVGLPLVAVRRLLLPRFPELLPAPKPPKLPFPVKGEPPCH